jgi:hypothetical protein
MLDFRILLIRVLQGVSVRLVSGDFGRDFFGHEFPNPIRIRPRHIPELIVETLKNVGESIEFRLRFAAPSIGTGSISAA